MKNKKLRKRERRGQHSGDVAVLALQDKKHVSKQNHEETKPVVICECNVTMLGVV